MKNTATVVSISLFTFLLLAQRSQAEMVKGVSLLPGGATDLYSPGSDKSIQHIADLGANTMAIPVFWFQDDLKATEVTPDTSLYSPTFSSLEHAIAEAQSYNMDVTLLPMLDTRDGQWRANINPSRRTSWQGSYADYILTMAELAEETGVSRLSLGTGLTSMQGDTSFWSQLRKDVSSVFGGDLTYVVDHNSLFAEDVPWLAELDQVWVDAYFQVSNKSNPSLAVLTNGWEDIAGRIANWHETSDLDQSVVFLNGYRSREGSAASPWDSWTQTSPDLKIQADSIQAELTALWDEDFFGGYVNWHANTDPRVGGPEDTSYVVKDKPAESVLRDWFSSTLSPELFPGDSNQDGEFNQLDIIMVLQAGKYLTGQSAAWAEGDWNGAPGGTRFTPPSGDNRFDQLDLIAALQAGIYNSGPYNAVSQISTVPEPSSLLLLALGTIVFLLCRRP